MVPRGSNGAGQAILDARALSRHLTNSPDTVTALRAYEAERRPSDDPGRAGQPEHAARPHPSRGVAADRRPAVHVDRGCDRDRGTRADLTAVQGGGLLLGRSSGVRRLTGGVNLAGPAGRSPP
ncbi:hypothetical protein ACFQX6_33245 [Streptosporangium lutulentum]